MRNSQTIGLIVLVIGILVVIVALFYDYLGGSPGIGPQQTAGIVAGFVITIIGIVIKFKKAKAKSV